MPNYSGGILNGLEMRESDDIDKHPNQNKNSISKWGYVNIKWYTANSNCYKNIQYTVDLFVPLKKWFLW